MPLIAFPVALAEMGIGHISPMLVGRVSWGKEKK